ncbi:MAG TPA: class I SAM-dependent methyltransferase [Streptosporangiaceae bacterium]|nr:class I SAM-dependent methyltransferase [Streptosporangiaceae bacterium]
MSNARTYSKDSFPERPLDGSASKITPVRSGQLAFGEKALVAAAVRWGAAEVAGWSDAERALAAAARLEEVAGLAVPDEIRRGGDPLGDALCALRDPAARRPLGQTFTPAAVIGSMIARASRSGCRPARVVDPGSGSARFLVAAGRRWPSAELVGVEIDPVAALVGRASLAAAGLAGRSRIILGDYRSVTLPPCAGPTLFLGNPPYVRHHQIAPQWKDWLRRAATSRGLPVSGLAGLHVHFFLATALHARPGDAGVLITAAEWLDVNYGRLVRGLLLGGLGGESLHLIEPSVPVFADAIATSVITCFRPGRATRRVRMARVAGPAELGALAGGVPVAASVLRATPRWGPLLRGTSPASAPARRPGVPGRCPPGLPGLPGRGLPGLPGRGLPGRGLPDGLVELGELCRVHRGQVTGANAVWVTDDPHPLVPARFQFAAVTRARELFAAGAVLPPGAVLRRVIDLPADLAELTPAERLALTRFLRAAVSAGAAGSYVARHRQPWWRVRLAGPPPILASYMARRPPAFVRNLAGARHLNIAHGLYPRDPLPPRLLDALARYLSQSVTTAEGRTYGGGLVKFEPREMERLLVPGPGLLATAGTAPDFQSPVSPRVGHRGAEPFTRS